MYFERNDMNYILLKAHSHIYSFCLQYPKKIYKKRHFIIINCLETTAEKKVSMKKQMKLKSLLETKYSLRISRKSNIFADFSFLQATKRFFFALK